MELSFIQKTLSFFLIFNLLLSSFQFLRAAAVSGGATSIAFETLGRSSYAFDIYATSTTGPPSEIRLTDGESVNFNGYFPSSSSISMLLPNSSDPAAHILYVTERNGSSSVYLDALYSASFSRAGSRVILESPVNSGRFQVPLLGDDHSGGGVSMKDKPSLVGSNLIYVSTHENPGSPRASWTAVYSTHLPTGSTRRLTPAGVADFSPAVSPSGVWTAVASLGKKGWTGEVEELGTDIHVFLTRDGSDRVKLVDHGGWPSWADDSTLYFHRKCEDGWWSVFQATFVSKDGKLSVDSVVTRRVTPPGSHAFTPAASVSNTSFIAVATRRPESEFRHIELFDVVSNSFTELTRPISPETHHYNPFISPDSGSIGYHKCRGSSNDLILENIRSPLTNLSLFRIDGSFPSYSPDGDRVAFVKFPGLFVMNSDGSRVRNVLNRTSFSTAWDWKRKGVVYTSVGPTFSSESTKVDIISINVDDKDSNLNYKQLTLGGENNAFPSPSPDGKWVVFRSGRTGHKNLYIMDSLEGESGGLYRLTEGPWTDTMCNWSPNGEWIAFASDRENPGSGSFELFKIRPNGTGLEKVIRSGLGGRVNHPWFSPDGQHIVLTSDYAGVSAEPISNPNHYQPYGDIFVVKSDGSGIERLTHNSYEDGTPAWSPKFTRPVSVEWAVERPNCSFDDCHWLDIGRNRALRGQCAR